MDFNIIEQIIKSNYDDEKKKQFIWLEIAEDEDAIPYILKVIDKKKKEQKELLNITNSLSGQFYAALECKDKKTLEVIKKRLLNFYIDFRDSIDTTEALITEKIKQENYDDTILTLWEKNPKMDYEERERKIKKQKKEVQK